MCRSMSIRTEHIHTPHLQNLAVHSVSSVNVPQEPIDGKATFLRYVNNTCREFLLIFSEATLSENSFNDTHKK